MMRRIFLSLLVVSIFTLLLDIESRAEERANSSSAGQTILAVSLNIRHDNAEDGENSWIYRQPVVESYFLSRTFDIIGLQEVEKHQLDWLKEILPGHASIGKPRQDGKAHGGESCPIFVNLGRFAIDDHSQFWLSATPQAPGSKGWDAALPRIVTWVKLREKVTDQAVFVFNTHFDHKGILAKQLSTDLLSEKISEIAGDAAIILMGDFNIRKKVRQGHSPLGKALYYNLKGTLADNNSLQDSYSIARVAPVSAGSTATRRFRRDASVIGSVEDAIDYIFVNDSFSVESYSVDRVMEDRVFISDHWPVVAELRLLTEGEPPR